MLAKFNALPLATKTTALTIAALLVLALTMFVVADRSITNEAARQAAERQEINMRVAWDVLRRDGAEFRRW